MAEFNVPDFDPVKYRLGALCKRQHDWHGTGQSLRRVSNQCCVECGKAWHQAKQSSDIDYVKSRKQAGDRFRARRISQRTPVTPAYFVGNLCKREHQYQDAQSSLRYSSNGDCVECARLSGAQPTRKRSHILSNQVYRQTAKGVEVGLRHVRKFRLTEAGREASRRNRRKRRALLLKVDRVPFTTLELQAHYKRFDDCCAYCGNCEDIQPDHFVPISKQGADALSNIVPACKPCNAAKNNREAKLWYESQPFYSQERWQRIVDTLRQS